MVPPAVTCDKRRIRRKQFPSYLDMGLMKMRSGSNPGRTRVGGFPVGSSLAQPSPTLHPDGLTPVEVMSMSTSDRLAQRGGEGLAHASLSPSRNWAAWGQHCRMAVVASSVNSFSCSSVVLFSCRQGREALGRWAAGAPCSGSVGGSPQPQIKPARRFPLH